jgi:hypothetical protein
MYADVASEHSTVNDGEYNVAGWLAIAAAVLTLPMFGFGLAMDIASHRVPKVALLLLVPYAIVSLAQMGFGLFAFARFRNFLNKRHGFHEVDALILTIIIGVIVIFFIAFPARVLTVLGVLEGPFVLIPIIAIAVVGISLGILGIIFAIRLMRLQSDLNGYLKPYAWITIAAGICFATFILSPVGMLLDAVGNVLLGMIFLKPEGETVEFV